MSLGSFGTHPVETDKFERTKFITGLRAYSALAVFLVHVYVLGFRGLNEVLVNFLTFGRFGIISFFLISSFTICMSIDNSSFTFSNYIVRRFFRIAPMFYLILVCCYLLNFSNVGFSNIYHVSNSITSFLMHISFLNLFDVRYLNNVIGVESTIPIEFFYYFLIPLIFFFLSKSKSNLFLFLTLALCFSLLSYFLFYPFYNPIDKAVSHHLSAEKYLFTFSLGIVTYVLISRSEKSYIFRSIDLFGWILLLMVFIFMKIPYQEYYFSIWVAVLVFICYSRNKFSILLFENKVIEFLGRISYSIYLIHFPVLTYSYKYLNPKLGTLVGFSLTIILSVITYYLVEQPFIDLGKKVTARYFRKPQKIDLI